MRFTPRLSALALRRALPPPALAAVFALAALILLVDSSPPESLLELAGVDPGQAERGLARRGSWLLWTAVCLPWLAHRGAATSAEWRRRDVDWLGALPVSRAWALTVSWAGITAAALTLSVLGAAISELSASRRAPGPSPALRFVRTLPAPPVTLTEADEAARWSIADPRERMRAGTRVRATLALAGGGPATEVELRARRAGGGAESSGSVRLASGRGRVSIPVPAGSGAVEFALTKGDDLAIATLVPEGFVLLEEDADASSSGAQVGTRVFLSGCALAGLALGLGAWMGPGLATLLALSLLPASWTLAALAPWWPGADLPAVLGLVGEGLLPGHPGPTAWIAAAGLATLGLAAAAWGLRGGRNPQ